MDFFIRNQVIEKSVSSGKGFIYINISTTKSVFVERLCVICIYKFNRKLRLYIQTLWNKMLLVTLKVV